MNLVIVESPAKAKTINKYLGSNYKVFASFGHVRDLPSKNGSVIPEEDFKMIYQIDKDSAKHVNAIAKETKDIEIIYLATDPDREGEAIAWHVIEALKEKKKLGKNTQIKRIVFNAITKKAVTEAIKIPREIDMDLVNAQQARRALDYLVGFNLSPILWRKLPGSRSAGRVQSVAVKLVCERESEIEAFKPQEYWTIEGDLAKSKTKISTRLVVHNGEKLEKFTINNEKQAKAITKKLDNQDFTVQSVTKKQSKRNPAPPFTTSTLQQEASRKLGFGAKKTMMVAQKIYESGLITYMRTDSLQVADEAVALARQVIKTSYGADYVPEKARFYKAKTKNAQEAHEAIRPVDISKKPADIEGNSDKDQFRLYDLIWKRMVASQMESVVLDQVVVEFENNKNILRANGSTINFDGFYKVYQEGKDDSKDDDKEKLLPPVKEGEVFNAKKITPSQHFTEPPPRFSEATIVKKLEELGIGRPSTYASIISVIQDRNYVKIEKKRFYPEDRGRIVTAFLNNFFSRYLDYNFTAELENELDEIAGGKCEWKKAMGEFWNKFKPTVDEVSELKAVDIIKTVEESLYNFIFPDGAESQKCTNCKDGTLHLKTGKFGAFLGCTNYPECKYTRQLMNAEGGEDMIEKVEDTVLGEKEGEPVLLKKGPYGFYVQLGEKSKKRTGLPKNITPDELTLEMAISLLSLPRELGKHPETGKVIKASLGRFGPYIQHEKTYASLGKDDDVLTVELERGLELLSQKKKSANNEPLRELGKHTDGSELAIYKGRYGAYIKHPKANAPIPKSLDMDSITLEQAIKAVDKKLKK